MTSLRPLNSTPSFYAPSTQSSIHLANSNYSIDKRDSSLLNLSCSTVRSRRGRANLLNDPKALSSRSPLPKSPPPYQCGSLKTRYVYSDILATSIPSNKEDESYLSIPYSARSSSSTRAALEMTCEAAEEEQDWAIFINNNYIASEASISASSFTNSTTSTCSTPSSASGHDGESMLDHRLHDEVEVIQSDCDSPSSVYSCDGEYETESAMGSNYPSSMLDHQEAPKDEERIVSEEKRKTATRELIQKLREERKRLQQGLSSITSTASPLVITARSERQLSQLESVEQNRSDIASSRSRQHVVNLEKLQTESKPNTKPSRRPSKPDAPLTPHTGNSARMVYLDKFSPSSACFGNAVINARASIYAAAIDDTQEISFSMRSNRRTKDPTHSDIASSGFCFDYDPHSPFFYTCNEVIEEV